MGYQSDLTESNRPLLVAVNKHNDNYSALNLNQDLVLITALISVFLQRTDFTDMELFSLNRKELCEMIELKRKLFETNIKLQHIRFAEDFALQKAKAYTSEDFTNIIQLITKTLFERLPREQVVEAMAEVEEIMKDYADASRF